MLWLPSCKPAESAVCMKTRDVLSLIITSMNRRTLWRVRRALGAGEREGRKEGGAKRGGNMERERPMCALISHINRPHGTSQQSTRRGRASMHSEKGKEELKVMLLLFRSKWICLKSKAKPSRLGSAKLLAQLHSHFRDATIHQGEEHK